MYAKRATARNWRNEMKLTRNKVFVSQDYMLFFQDFKETDPHIHATKHLAISLQGIMNCKLADTELQCFGYILNAGVLHERYGENANGQKIIFILEPCSPVAIKIEREILKGESYQLLQEQMAMEIKEKLGERIKEENVTQEMVEQIFAICHLTGDMSDRLDPRVAQLVKILREEETITAEIVENAISVTGLSKSRFLHLFKQEIGVSLKKYLQCLKFFKTWRYLAEGENITDACLHAGFNDSAHYSNFMKQCYGMSTKQELKIICDIHFIE